ncbi:MAG: hypothetical protein AB8G22_18600 [Saprospiraceae bacterium]
MNIKNLTYIAFLLAAFGCEPTEDIALDLTQLPSAPEISVRQLDDEPNFVEIELMSTDGIYDFVWDAPGGNPNFSKERKDTVLYVKAGEYDISVHIAAIGGTGTATNKKTVQIVEDATGICDPVMDLLTGGCESQCWKLSEAAGSIKVGPSQLSGEWFSSNEITPEQANDRFCFTAEDFVFVFDDAGEAFLACEGYVGVENYEQPDNISFRMGAASSEYAETQFTFDKEGVFFGTDDSGPFYQIVSIDEEEMIILSPIQPCDGAESPGWFTFTFIAE